MFHCITKIEIAMCVLFVFFFPHLSLAVTDSINEVSLLTVIPSFLVKRIIFALHDTVLKCDSVLGSVFFSSYESTFERHQFQSPSICKIQIVDLVNIFLDQPGDWQPG